MDLDAILKDGDDGDVDVHDDEIVDSDHSGEEVDSFGDKENPHVDDKRNTGEGKKERKRRRRKDVDKKGKGSKKETKKERKSKSKTEAKKDHKKERKKEHKKDRKRKSDRHDDDDGDDVDANVLHPKSPLKKGTLSISKRHSQVSSQSHTPQHKGSTRRRHRSSKKGNAHDDKTRRRSAEIKASSLWKSDTSKSHSVVSPSSEDAMPSHMDGDTPTGPPSSSSSSSTSTTTTRVETSEDHCNTDDVPSMEEEKKHESAHRPAKQSTATKLRGRERLKGSGSDRGRRRAPLIVLPPGASPMSSSYSSLPKSPPRDASIGDSTHLDDEGDLMMVETRVAHRLVPKGAKRTIRRAAKSLSPGRNGHSPRSRTRHRSPSPSRRSKRSSPSPSPDEEHEHEDAEGASTHHDEDEWMNPNPNASHPPKDGRTGAQSHSIRRRRASGRKPPPPEVLVVDPYSDKGRQMVLAIMKKYRTPLMAYLRTTCGLMEDSSTTSSSVMMFKMGPITRLVESTAVFSLFGVCEGFDAIQREYERTSRREMYTGERINWDGIGKTLYHALRKLEKVISALLHPPREDETHQTAGQTHRDGSVTIEEANDDEEVINKASGEGNEEDVNDHDGDANDHDGDANDHDGDDNDHDGDDNDHDGDATHQRVIHHRTSKDSNTHTSSSSPSPSSSGEDVEMINGPQDSTKRLRHTTREQPSNRAAAHNIIVMDGEEHNHGPEMLKEMAKGAGALRAELQEELEILRMVPGSRKSLFKLRVILQRPSTKSLIAQAHAELLGLLCPIVLEFFKSATVVKENSFTPNSSPHHSPVTARRSASIPSPQQAQGDESRHTSLPHTSTPLTGKGVPNPAIRSMSMQHNVASMSLEDLFAFKHVGHAHLFSPSTPAEAEEIAGVLHLRLKSLYGVRGNLKKKSELFCGISCMGGGGLNRTLLKPTQSSFRSFSAGGDELKIPTSGRRRKGSFRGSLRRRSRNGKDLGLDNSSLGSSSSSAMSGGGKDQHIDRSGGNLRKARENLRLAEEHLIGCVACYISSAAAAVWDSVMRVPITRGCTALRISVFVTSSSGSGKRGVGVTLLGCVTLVMKTVKLDGEMCPIDQPLVVDPMVLKQRADGITDAAFGPFEKRISLKRTGLQIEGARLSFEVIFEPKSSSHQVTSAPEAAAGDAHTVNAPEDGMPTDGRAGDQRESTLTHTREKEIEEKKKEKKRSGGSEKKKEKKRSGGSEKKKGKKKTKNSDKNSDECDECVVKQQSTLMMDDGKDLSPSVLPHSFLSLEGSSSASPRPKSARSMSFLSSSEPNGPTRGKAFHLTPLMTRKGRKGSKRGRSKSPMGLRTSSVNHSTSSQCSIDEAKDSTTAPQPHTTPTAPLDGREDLIPLAHTSSAAIGEEFAHVLSSTSLASSGGDGGGGDDGIRTSHADVSREGSKDEAMEHIGGSDGMAHHHHSDGEEHIHNEAREEDDNVQQLNGNTRGAKKGITRGTREHVAGNLDQRQFREHMEAIDEDKVISKDEVLLYTCTVYYVRRHMGAVHPLSGLLYLTDRHIAFYRIRGVTRLVHTDNNAHSWIHSLEDLLLLERGKRIHVNSLFLGFSCSPRKVRIECKESDREAIIALLQNEQTDSRDSLLGVSDDDGDVIDPSSSAMVDELPSDGGGDVMDGDGESAVVEEEEDVDSHSSGGEENSVEKRMDNGPSSMKGETSQDVMMEEETSLGEEQHEKEERPMERQIDAIMTEEVIQREAEMKKRIEAILSRVEWERVEREKVLGEKRRLKRLREMQLEAKSRVPSHAGRDGFLGYIGVFSFLVILLCCLPGLQTSSWWSLLIISAQLAAGVSVLHHALYRYSAALLAWTVAKMCGPASKLTLLQRYLFPHLTMPLLYDMYIIFLVQWIVSGVEMQSFAGLLMFGFYMHGLAFFPDAIAIVSNVLQTPIQSEAGGASISEKASAVRARIGMGPIVIDGRKCKED